MKDIHAVPRSSHESLHATLSGSVIESALNRHDRLIGRAVRYYECVESSNDSASILARNSAEEGTAVIADSQTNGRGRLGRRWESPPGCNIYTSIILRPPLSASDAPQLTFLTAVAVFETIAYFLPADIPVCLKWPNDVIAASKKISGILAEMSTVRDKLDFVVVGIGINVNCIRDQFSSEVGSSSVSIGGLSGVTVSRVDVIERLYSRIEEWYLRYLSEGFSPIRDVWSEYSAIRGKELTIQKVDGYFRGRALGISEDGSLRVMSEDGMVLKIVDADIVITD